jgi:hypothetical protein
VDIVLADTPFKITNKTIALASGLSIEALQSKIGEKNHAIESCLLQVTIWRVCNLYFISAKTINHKPKLLFLYLRILGRRHIDEKLDAATVLAASGTALPCVTLEHQCRYRNRFD